MYEKNMHNVRKATRLRNDSIESSRCVDSFARSDESGLRRLLQAGYLTPNENGTVSERRDMQVTCALSVK